MNDCDEVRELFDIQVTCCDTCHEWMRDGIVRGYIIKHNETRYELCCQVMNVLEARKMIGECKNGIFDLRV